jgi:hypothetical protein
MLRYKKEFSDNLLGIEFDTIEQNTESIYGLSKELTFNYFNPAWFQFAKENGGESTIANNYPLGTSLTKVLPQSLQQFYVTKYTEVLATGKVWHHEYECSSSTLFRIFNQSTYPLKNGNGLVVINRLSVQLPMNQLNRPESKPLEEQYTHDTGFIHQCCNCRSIQRVANPDTWDWVPAWVTNIPEETSHTICPVCYDYYWVHGKIPYPLSNEAE